MAVLPHFKPGQGASIRAFDFRVDMMDSRFVLIRQTQRATATVMSSGGEGFTVYF